MATEEKEEPKSTSSWLDTVEMPEYKSLDQSISTDVCVIGAGIAGLTTAYVLSQSGKKVVVLDKDAIGNGQTGLTTAHCSNVFDDRFAELVRDFGSDIAKLVVESHTAAIDFIERTAKQENIECEFERVDGYLFVPPGTRRDVLSREYTLALRLDLLPVERVDSAPIPGINTGQCLKFPNQGQFHPLKYLAGLAKAIENNGGKIFTKTKVTGIDEDKPLRVHTNHGSIVTAQSVVMATNAPIQDNLIISTKQAPYRTYVIGAKVPKDSVARALFWDTEDPYHYIRLQNLDETSDLLIVGGEDHKTGQEDDGEDRFQNLEDWTQERFPMAQTVEYQWSGQVQEPVDGLAYIGRQALHPNNIYIITGDSGQGMTHGTIGGMLISDLILGQRNRWERVYDPNRVTVPAAPDFIQEGINVAQQYLDWITPGDVDSYTDIKPGEGAVVREGLVKVAAYRDDKGQLHKRSAVCPHLSCIVAWNSTEKMWDCPCHGSQFDPNGKVITGPARENLKRLEQG